MGVANIASGLGGGFPVTGGFSRSVVNFEAGAKTLFTGVITAIMIAMTTLFLTALFEYFPKAVLAATVIVAVLSLVDLKAIHRVWVFSKPRFLGNVNDDRCSPRDRNRSRNSRRNCSFN